MMMMPDDDGSSRELFVSSLLLNNTCNLYFCITDVRLGHYVPNHLKPVHLNEINQHVTEQCERILLFFK